LEYFNSLVKSQWRGNYFRTVGARPRAPSGTRNKVLRWYWSVFCPEKKRSQKKKVSAGLGASFCLKNGSGYKSQGGAKVAQVGPKYLQGGGWPPPPPPPPPAFKTKKLLKKIKSERNENDTLLRQRKKNTKSTPPSGKVKEKTTTKEKYQKTNLQSKFDGNDEGLSPPWFSLITSLLLTSIGVFCKETSNRAD